MSSRRRVWPILALLASVLIAGPGLAPAVAETYGGMDLVFLVDESDSIFRNDTKEIRFDGLPWAFDWLGRLRLEKDLDRRYTFRVAVVFFGSRVEKMDFAKPGEPARYWEEIAPQSDDAWGVQQSALEERVAAYRASLRDGLGMTDVLRGLREARGILDSMETQDRALGVTAPRLRAVVVITDGVPDVVDPAGDRCENHQPVVEPGAPPRCALSDLMRELFDEIPAVLPSSYSSLYVLGLNDSREVYWQSVQNAWAGLTGGRAKLTESNLRFFGDIQAYLNELVAPLALGLGEQKIGCSRTAIPPYLKLVRFTFHKPDPDARVSILDPNSNPVVADGVVVRGQDSAIETVTIPNPTPGSWVLKCPEGVLEPPTIYMDTVKVQAALSVPAVYQYVPVYLKYTILGDGDLPLPEYADAKYHLDLRAEVSGVGSSLNVPLLRDGDEYVGGFVLGSAGDFTLNLVGRTRNVDDTPVEVFTHTQAIRASPTHFRLTEPTTVSTFLVPTTLAFGLFDDSELIVPLSSTSPGVLSMKADLISTGDRLTLNPSLDADSAFRLGFTPERMGEFVVSAVMQVNDPAAGSLDTPAMEAGQLVVSPPLAILESPSGQQPQHVAFRVAYRFTDQQENALTEVLDKDYRLAAAASLAHEGHETTIALAPEGKGSFLGEFRPDGDGLYSLHVRLTADDSRGNTVVLIDQDDAPISVYPTTLVRYAIVEPADKSQREWRNALNQPNDFVVVVDLEDENGQRVGPDVVLLPGTRIPFAVTVTMPDGVPVDLSLEATGTPGRYRAAVSDLHDLGLYQVAVQPVPGVLKPDHVFDETSRLAQVELIENSVLAFYARWKLLINSLLGAIVAGLVLLMAHPYFWPARGTLIVTKPGEDDKMHRYTLDAYHKHKLDLRLPDWAGGGKLRVCQGWKASGVKLGPSKLNLLPDQTLALGNGVHVTYKSSQANAVGVEPTLPGWG